MTAALDCADAGAAVTLVEVRPRLGGAAYSFERDGLWLDNGQHVFLRCCEAYRALLERLGSTGDTALQERLAIPVIASGGRVAWLRRTGLPAPLHLAGSLLRYRHLSPGERISAARDGRRKGTGSERPKRSSYRRATGLSSGRRLTGDTLKAPSHRHWTTC